MSVGNLNVRERTHLRPSRPSSVNCDVHDKPVRQTWVKSGRVFTSVGYQWKPTGRKFTIGSSGLVDKLAKDRCTIVRKWTPTGRIIPLGSGHVKPIIANANREMSSCCDNFVHNKCDNSVISNHSEPNCSWGSMSFSYPFWSDFKCRSFKSSCGIWT